MQGGRGYSNTRKHLKEKSNGGKAMNPVKLVLYGATAALLIWAGVILYFFYGTQAVENSEKLSLRDAGMGSKVASTLTPVYNEENDLDTAKAMFFSQPNCQENSLLLEVEDTEDDLATDMCKIATGSKQLMSVKIVASSNRRIVDVFSSCSKSDSTRYSASIYPLDGCVNIYNYPKVGIIKFADSNLDKKQITAKDVLAQYHAQETKPTHFSTAHAKVRIVFSSESSEYFGYQVWANYYGFLSSGQKSASWTRLLTARERDDLPNHNPGLATFQARRHLYARRYSPINKADVIQKWYASADAPKEEIILVIDPDNWIIKDVSPWVEKVRKGHALGEAAYYHGSTTAQRLWKELCEHNCDLDLDLVGVPYVVHRDDLKEIAPLWKHYSLKIKEMLEERNPDHDSFGKKYKSLDVNWASEMFGYNMAAAHAGVPHEVIRRMQVRDVAGTRSKEKLKDVAMIHMGRAWFPKNDPSAKKWAHTEGKSFSGFGQQVWCKCNFTASTIIPWPVPEGSDFQSTKTLETLHNSMVKFGPVPVNKRYRKGAETRSDYSWSMP